MIESLVGELAATPGAGGGPCSSASHDDRARGAWTIRLPSFRPRRRLVRAAAEQRLYWQAPFAARLTTVGRGSQHHGRRSAVQLPGCFCRCSRGGGLTAYCCPVTSGPLELLALLYPCAPRSLGVFDPDGMPMGRRDLRRLRRRDRDGDYILACSRRTRAGHARRRARRRVAALRAAPRQVTARFAAEGFEPIFARRRFRRSSPAICNCWSAFRRKAGIARASRCSPSHRRRRPRAELTDTMTHWPGMTSAGRIGACSPRS